MFLSGALAAGAPLSGQATPSASATPTPGVLLVRSDSMLRAGNAEGALVVAEQALRRHLAGDDPGRRLTATLHFRLANIHWTLGHPGAAARSLEAGLAIRREPDPLLFLANLLAQRSEEDERAVSLYREAIDSVEAGDHFEDDRLLPAYLSPFGNFLAARGRYDEAISVLERAAAIQEAVHGEESEAAGEARFHLATALHRAGRLDEAAREYEAAREPLFAYPTEGFEGGPRVRRYRALLAWTADLHETRGNLQDALQDRITVLEYLDADPAADPADRRFHVARLSALNLALGQYVAADLQAARLVRETPEDADATVTAQTVALYARALRYARRYEDAALLLDTALAEITEPAARRYLEAQRAFLNLAVGAYAEAETGLRELAAGAPPGQRGPLESALRRLYIETGRWREAAALDSEPPDPAGRGADRALAAAWIDHGLLLEHQGRLAEAEAALTHAIGMLTRHWLAYERFPEDVRSLYSPITYAHPEERIVALAGRARVRRTRGALSGALEDAREAAAGLDMLVRMQDFDEMREARLRSEHRVVADELVAVHVDRGDAWGAVHAAERARGSMLVQRMYGGGLMSQIEWSAVDDDLAADMRQRLARASGAVSRLQDAIREAEAGAATPARAAALRDSLRTADRSLERLRREVVGLIAGGVDYGATWEDSIPVAELTRALGTGTEPVLLYHLGEAASHAFLVRGAAPPRVFPLVMGEAEASVLGMEPGPVTRESVARLMSGPGSLLPSGGGADRSGERGATRGGFTPARSLALRRALLPDPLLQRLVDRDRAVIIPDGALHLLPFALLVLDNGGDAPVYLPDRGPRIRYVSSLQYAYTLALFADAVSARHGGGPSLLTVSDPDFRVGGQATAQRPDAAIPLDRGEWLSPLPGTAAEADSLAQIFTTAMADGSVTRLSGDGATEARVRSSIPGHDYLHFATHGLVDERRSALFASLAFTPGPSAVPENDGLLQLHEIYELPLRDVDLAVLSACETNRGDVTGGEGVFALSRGFLGAGARRVLATQWPVDDAATAAFVAAFFRSVARQRRDVMEPDFTLALAQARRAVRTDEAHPEWAHPYYWAPFVLIGK